MRATWTLLRLSAAGSLLAIAMPAAAATVIIPDSGDTGWLLGTLLIGLLTAIPGILLYAIGRNGWASAPRILASAVAGMAIATLLMFVIGYSLMFDVAGESALGAWIGGGSNWMLNLMGTVREGTTVPETGFVLFQLGFVLLAVALLSTLLAPRARPGWLLGFTGLWLLLVLVPVTRWIWGGGWLSEMGAFDGSGGLTVFLTVAVSALTARVLIGQARQDIVASDNGTSLIGAFLLLLGMMALAGGATLGASDNSAVAMLSMLAAAMTGALTVAAVNRSLDAGALAKGMVAGIVAIACAGDGVSVGGAIIIGLMAALTVALAPRLTPAFIARYDSGGALVGLISAAKVGALLFAIFLAFTPFGGSGYAEGMTMGSQLIAQFAALLAISGWAVAGTLIAGIMVRLVTPMRDETGSNPS